MSIKAGKTEKGRFFSLERRVLLTGVGISEKKGTENQPSRLIQKRGNEGGVVCPVHKSGPYQPQKKKINGRGSVTLSEVEYIHIGIQKRYHMT